MSIKALASEIASCAIMASKPRMRIGHEMRGMPIARRSRRPALWAKPFIAIVKA